MSILIQRYAVIENENWTVGSLLHASNEQRKGIKLIDCVELNPVRLDLKRLNNEKDYDYIELTSISVEQGIIKDVKTFKVDEIPKRAKYIAKAGDVLLSTVRPERGAVAIVPKELDGAMVSSALVVLRPASINAELLYFILRSDTCKEDLLRLSAGTSIPTVSIQAIKDYILPIEKVTLTMQSKANELYNQWLNHQMNTRTLKELADAEFGNILLQSNGETKTESNTSTIPYDQLTDRWDASFYMKNNAKTNIWNTPIKVLSELFNSTANGKTPSSGSMENQGTPFVKISDLNNESINLNEVSLYVEDGDYGQATLEKGDLLIARVGSIGKTNVVGEKLHGAIANQNLLIAKVNSDVLAEYVALYLKSSWGMEQVEANKVGIAQPFLQQSAWDKIQIPVPSLEQQIQMVERVQVRLLSVNSDDIERKIANWIRGLTDTAS